MSASRTLRQLLLCAVSTLAVAGTAQAQQTLYGMAYMGDNGPATLYTLSTANGTATAVGPTGFERCSGMDFDATSQLYATCERNDGSNIGVLVRINTSTGAGTEVGPTGLPGAVSDISFRPSDGVLFAYEATNDPTHSVYIINTTTGAATLVGDTSLSFAGGNAMAFNSAGTLYHSQFSAGPSPDLNTLNTTTGAATFVQQLTPVTGRFSSMDAQPGTNLLFAMLNSGSGGAGPNELATINPASGAVTVLGQSVNGMDALAFRGVIPAGPPVPLPSLGVLGLISLVLLFGVLGGVLLRRT
jgi:hypothetical protein